MGSGYLFSKPLVCFVMSRLKHFSNHFVTKCKGLKNNIKRYYLKEMSDRIVGKVKTRFTSFEKLRSIVKPWYQITHSTRK